MNARKVLFFTTTLGGGGAESHAMRVMNYLDRDRWSPVLAVAKAGGSYEQFLAPDIRVIPVSFDRVPSSTGRLFLSVPGLRRLIESERPDLLCSVMDPPSILALATAASLAKAPPVVACVQVPPLMDGPRTFLGRNFVLPAIRHLYSRARRVIALSHGVKTELVRLDARLERTTVVIHNACVDDRILEQAPDGADVPESGRPVVIAAGRLQPEKAFDNLLSAFAILRRKVDAELWILGEGRERQKLERQRDELRLAGHVKFLGFQKHPHNFMRKATVFALSSLYEGFGNVIVESLACGTPVVATDCPYGPGEILSNDRGGLLVPVADPPALAQALERVIVDNDLRNRLRTAGLERATSFSARAIADAYSREFERVLS